MSVQLKMRCVSHKSGQEDGKPQQVQLVLISDENNGGRPGEVFQVVVTAIGDVPVSSIHDIAYNGWASVELGSTPEPRIVSPGKEGRR